MTPCERLIRSEIESKGPLSIERFMEIALHHPTHGYYAKAPAIGGDADFITAPEISQMFGEIVAAWCVDLWYQMGCPSPFNLVELGPGRGTLMVDILKIFAQVPELWEGLHVYLIERNETLKDIQAQVLDTSHVTWCDHLCEVPTTTPAIVIANEFFDAFPARQFTKTPEGSFEKHITLTHEKLTFVDLPCTETPSSLEDSPQAEDYLKDLCEFLNRTEGAALILDYGYGNGTGHTVQALKSHMPVGLLESIGAADITAHVNFGAFARIAEDLGLQVWGPTFQGDFLTQLGIIQRSERLKSHNPAEAALIASQLMRLVHPHQMGTLFKVMALCATDHLIPGGFDD